MLRARRFAVGVLVAALALGGAVVVEEAPASAAKVANPGSAYALRVHTGDMAIREEGFSFVDEGRLPQCSDGSNNDSPQDTSVDFPADGQCSSAADDSETAGGLQPKAPIQLSNGTIDAAGNVSFPASGVSFPQQYLFVAAGAASGGIVADFIVRITISAIAPFTGTVNPLTGAMNLRMQVRVDLDNHGDGPLGGSCAVSPVDINAAITGTSSGPGPKPPLTGSPLDNGTGRVTLVNTNYSVPGASGCGTVAFVYSLDGAINDQLGLPSPSGENSASFTAEFTPIRPAPAVTATFTATPSSGPAPLTVSFNANASTGTGRTYQWDLDGNGSFDGGVTSATPSFTYNTAGNRTVKLRVTDSGGDFVETTRLVQVGANQPPTANDQVVVTSEDVPIPVTLTASDPEGGAVTFARSGANPANGTATCTSAGACTYTPTPNFAGTNTFGFTATDAFGNTDAGVVTVHVTAVNDAPSATDVSATVVEDSAGPVTLVGNDLDGDTLTYNVLTPPALGTLSGTGGALTYTPNGDATGTDTFTYDVSDPSGLHSAVATATVNITAVNDAPVADAASVTTAEETAVGIVLTGSDVDGDTLTYSLVSLPSGGSLSGTPPNLTFTPAANAHGNTSFTFRATDPSGASSTAVVDVTVTPVNDGPTTGNVSVSTTEDTPVDVGIVATDVDGDALTYTPSAAANGAVSCAGNVCTYTPTTGFSGTDSFTVTVADPGGLTAVSTVTISVSALNNTSPGINDATVVVLEDAARNFTLSSVDADGDPRHHAVLVGPSSGTLTCSTAGACTYVPTADANGNVTFVVEVSDGRGGVDTATITLAIVPINDAPVVAPGQALVTAEDSVGLLDLAGADVDGDTVTWTVKRHPAKGTIACDSAGACTFTPQPNANGPDSFEVEASDGHGARVRVTIPITIDGVDDPAVAGTVTRTLQEDAAPDSFTLLGADPDGGTVTFAAAPAASGTLVCSGAGSCSFVPATDAMGTETIAYTVTDSGGSSTGAIVLTIVPVNDAPVAGSLTLATPEDTPVPFALPASDPDLGDSLSYYLTSAPTQGTVSGAGANRTYNPAANASGTVSFTFAARDVAGAESTGTVTITVLPTDDLPVAGSTAFVTAEDTAVMIALTGSDEEGPVTLAVSAPPAHGSYAGGVYTPALNYNGPDTIGYTATDTSNQVTAGTVAITVTPVNDPPVASSSTVSTTRTVPVPVTLAGTDPDGPSTLTYTVLTGPTKGTLSGTAPNLTYTPTGFNTGSDALTFRVTDASGATDSATVTITINQGPALATQQTVAPATVTRPGGLVGFLYPYTYNNLKSTLTTTGGLPVSGQVIAFRVNGTQICTATTNASGVATCAGTGPRVAASTYTATFGGTAAFAASTATGSLS